MSNLVHGWVILKFNNSILEQKIFSSLYSNFILNLYIVYELNNWPRNPTNNFTLKNCLCGTVKLTKNKNKSKFTCNGERIAFDGKGYWSFDNDYDRNVAIFGVDNSSSSHIDNPKNNLSVSCKGRSEGINSCVGSEGKKININFSEANTKFCLSLHYNGDESYLYVNQTEIYKFKGKYNIVSIIFL